MSDVTEKSATAEDPVDPVRPLAVPRRSRWLTRGLPGLGLVLVVLLAAGAGVWWFSPWEHLSGAGGAPPRPRDGVPAQGADRFRDTTDPVLVAGALVERHDGAVRAIDLARGTTWWSISRPGRVRIDSIGRVDDRHAALVWSDRRLTVVDVPSGHRIHVELPDRSAANLSDLDPWSPTDPTVGLSGVAGRPLVAVVQPFGVDTYDASSGQRVWSRTAPKGCVFREPVDAQQQEGSLLSVDVACADANATHDDPFDTNAYSTLLDAASGQPLPHFDRFQYGALDLIGDHELLQHALNGVVDQGYHVIDSRTGRVLWSVAPLTAQEQVSAGAGLVVVSHLDADQITVYRATDGKQLWQHTFTSGDEWVEMLPATVVGGQVRVIVGPAPSFRVATLDSAGNIEGNQDLPMFHQGGDPRLVGGEDGTLVVEDLNTYLYDYPDPPYVLLTASR